jgi:hypothetical protein
MLNRDKAIEILVDCEFTTIFDGEDFGVDHLEWILRNGCKGFDNMTDEQLISELVERGLDVSNYMED